MTIAKKQCMVYLKVAEAVLFARISSYLWPWSRSQPAQLDTNQTGDEIIVAATRIRGARIRVQSMSTPLGSYPDDEIRSGSAG